MSFKTLTNGNIYTYITKLTENFDKNDHSYPAKVNFCILQNKKTLTSLASAIEDSRIEIIKKYGELTDVESGQYTVPTNKIEEANKELQDLFNISQDVQLLMLHIEDFGTCEMTLDQMDALMFMIEEEKE